MKIVWSWILYKFKKDLRVFNVLLNHDFNVVNPIDKETLLSELSIVARSPEHAAKIATYQINLINNHLAANFKIEKIWKLKTKVNNLKKNGVVVPLYALTEDDLKITNYKKHLVYLQEEFNFCKGKDQFCSVQ